MKSPRYIEVRYCSNYWRWRPDQWPWCAESGQGRRQRGMVEGARARRGAMKRRTRRQQIKRRREAWWWHYLPLHRGTIGGHLGPPADDPATGS
ncbi:hypothetical protein H2136_15075 [Aeromonas hydrophila]|uniref:Uncharacterized protein n=1 Tax=Aeromonas hydrophila TaxID=644 RepID=A0A926IZ30_AERHY|nr:hypothetical protein [Aeromonas hydrophila]